MKIALLCANIKDDLLFNIKQNIARVFAELESEVEEINLEILPYFSGGKSVMGDQIFAAIGECNGIVAFSNIHLTGIHGAMQTFLNYASVYQDIVYNKPLLALTYSNTWGEENAAQLISSAWRFLGGVDVNPLALNFYLSAEDISKVVEKQMENYYRLINQGIANIVSTERMLFLNRNTTAIGGHASASFAAAPAPASASFAATPAPASVSFAAAPAPASASFAAAPAPAITSFTAPPTQYNTSAQYTEVSAALPTVPISYTEVSTALPSATTVPVSTATFRAPASYTTNITDEKEIQEITNMLKGKIPDNSFATAPAGMYQKPNSRTPKKIASLPHYFVAQHDRGFAAIIQYLINDTKESGYITIQNGDCIYAEGIVDNYTVEISMLDSVFDELITKALSYQKAFMVGRIKVKGNFAILPQLDKIFRSSREYN